MSSIANGIASARKYLNIISLKQYRTMTSRRQISLFTEDESTLLPEGSHASRTARPGSDAEKKMTATSGQKCLDAFGRFPRVGLWGKTFSALLIGMGGWYSKRCALTWKLKGTKSNRMYFQLVPSKPLISDKESGSLPTEMLPTPTAQIIKHSHKKEYWDKRIKDGRQEDLSMVIHGHNGMTSQLNPQFVEEMMGFPENWTASPFQSGEMNQLKHTGTP